MPGIEIVAVGGSWHGVTGGTSAVSFASDRKGYGVPVPGVYVVPEPNEYRPYIEGLSGEESALACLDVGLKMYDMASTGQGAAIIIEPIISAGGVLVPPRAYMEAHLNAIYLESHELAARSPKGRAGREKRRTTQRR